jgi:hypothetical protein
MSTYCNKGSVHRRVLSSALNKCAISDNQAPLAQNRLPSYLAYVSVFGENHHRTRARTFLATAHRLPSPPLHPPRMHQRGAAQNGASTLRLKTIIFRNLIAKPPSAAQKADGRAARRWI